MTKIGIIGAMDEEIEILKDFMIMEDTKNIAGMNFYIGKLKNKEIILVRSGIGKVNAAVCTQILVSNFNVSHIINTGVAGAVHEDLEIGDIVISSDVIEHDFDATGFGYKLGEIPRMDTYIFKADEEMINIAYEASKCETIMHSTKVGRILSGDIFVASPDKKELLWNIFKGYCTEMEGASIGHTSYLNNIPFVIIRSISDKADGTAHINFNEFVLQAARNSSNIVMNIIENI
ncbi:5'-methylthioadenosine/adenosylhomocysteine nucleosidase [Paramaledivibacter caminithermalis]|jgi:adenosylhomocysteine nucleosidase|uniref:adenosylhomocysteine nucleosidase n=1 Tax=Paramaledivibacter caminithermalis (strain DSM 15212 / CIP 107654 / DViRD3) TaxID=1121301 RepID=A0A1M6NGL2_PARC5|nr:5'-methylthioadenosine/adenosylhomocysteine nucleosidase [Paramaledivibacter caminithermalis]SHJ94756.1 methylthioadenosine nucleosidase /adenosylhomocysteine nucleosidase [Paramaledivibacter caminithermalis DSM 15212]